MLTGERNHKLTQIPQQKPTLDDHIHIPGHEAVGEEFKVILAENPKVPYLINQDDYGLLLCIDGSINYPWDTSSRSVSTGGIHFSRPGEHPRFILPSPNGKYYLALFKKNFISEKVFREIKLENLLEPTLMASPVSHLEQERLTLIQYLFSRIHREYINEQDLRVEMLRFLFIEILVEVARSSRACSERFRQHIPYNRSGQLSKHFFELLEKHFIELRLVQDYADKLFVSAKHLSEVIKQETGQTALGSIHDKIFSEARFLLCRTEMSIKEIADQLNFDTSSHFSRFFRQFSGYNPSAYRTIKCSLN